MTLTNLKNTFSPAGIRPLRSSVLRAGAAALLALAPFLLGGCGGDNDNDALNTSSRNNTLSSLFRATVSVGSANAPASAQYDCWVASRPSQRDEGFAFISASEIPPGRGMVLVYPSNREVAFAGRSTLVDLAVVFAEASGEGIGRIVKIDSIGAFQSTPVSPGKLVKYVLFVPAADLARSGAKVGDLLFIPVVTPKN